MPAVQVFALPATLAAPVEARFDRPFVTYQKPACGSCRRPALYLPLQQMSGSRARAAVNIVRLDEKVPAVKSFPMDATLLTEGGR